MKHLLKTAMLGLALSTTLHAPTLLAAEPVASAANHGQLAAGPKAELTWKNVPTQTIEAGGVNFAYRELGQHHGGTPVVLLTHLAAVLDNWDTPFIGLQH
jgi:hypothetical protein